MCTSVGYMYQLHVFECVLRVREDDTCINVNVSTCVMRRLDVRHHATWRTMSEHVSAMIHYVDTCINTSASWYISDTCIMVEASVTHMYQSTSRVHLCPSCGGELPSTHDTCINAMYYARSSFDDGLEVNIHLKYMYQVECRPRCHPTTNPSWATKVRRIIIHVWYINWYMYHRWPKPLRLPKPSSYEDLGESIVQKWSGLIDT